MTEPRKYFTPEEANRALPLVKKVVSDILDSYAEWRRRVEEYEVLVVASNETAESDEHAAARKTVEETASQINEFIEELVQVGCVLKGFDDGLVDFYCKMDGRDVFLCWKFGEEQVSHWHEIETGFAGRQPLTQNLVRPNAN